jgi:hypothetical protein
MEEDVIPGKPLNEQPVKLHQFIEQFQKKK